MYGKNNQGGLSMQKVAVLGCTGMAGHVIYKYLEEKSYDVYGTSRSVRNSNKTKRIDAADFPKLEKWLNAICPDIIINCIGVLLGDADQQPDIAILFNSYLPHWLENRYKNTKVRIIHISTDCVFSGKRGHYLEDDFMEGDTLYDRTKALGEIKNHKDLTFRMSIIGPDISKNGIGLFNWFMTQRGVIRGYTNAYWNGITTIELARGIDEAIKNNLSGLYHLVPDETISKYHLLLMFKEVFEIKDVEIEPYDKVIIDKTLVNTRSDFDFHVKTYKDMLIDMRQWIEVHKDDYRSIY